MAANDPEKAQLRRCPECAEEIQKEAKVCRHCGHRIGGSPPPAQASTVIVTPQNRGFFKSCVTISAIIVVVIAVLLILSLMASGFINVSEQDASYDAVPEGEEAPGEAAGEETAASTALEDIASLLARRDPKACAHPDVQNDLRNDATTAFDNFVDKEIAQAAREAAELSLSTFSLADIDRDTGRMTCNANMTVGIGETVRTLPVFYELSPSLDAQYVATIQSNVEAPKQFIRETMEAYFLGRLMSQDQQTNAS